MGEFQRPAFAVERVIGASHLRTGKPCQDEAGVWSVADAVAVAVADGHGTSKHADVGARLAVHVALAALVRFSEDLGEKSTRISAVQKFAEHPLKVQLVREWVARVRAKAGDEQVPLLDYGSTLLFALATPDFLLVGQIGDGDVLVVAGDGTVSVPLPADPSAFADETPSLCLPEAWHSIRVSALPAPSSEYLLLLSTDGYSKSYATDAAFQQIGPDYLDLLRERGVPGLTPHLRGFLEQVTTQGSGDDIALAMLYWPQFPAAKVTNLLKESPDVIESVESAAVESSNGDGQDGPACAEPQPDHDPEPKPNLAAANMGTLRDTRAKPPDAAGSAMERADPAVLEICRRVSPDTPVGEPKDAVEDAPEKEGMGDARTTENS